MDNKEDISFETKRFLKDTEFLPMELHHWVSMGDEFLIETKHILSLYPEYISSLTTKYDTPLLLAARNYAPTTFKYLYSFNGCDPKPFNSDGNLVFNLLHTQIYEKKIRQNIFEILDFLYERQPELFLETNPNGENVFFITALYGDDFLFSYFEEKLGEEKTKSLINSLNNFNENILFNLCRNSNNHFNYGLIDLIENYLDNKDVILVESDAKQNIFQCITSIEDAAENVIQYNAYQDYFRFVKKIPEYYIENDKIE